MFDLQRSKRGDLSTSEKGGENDVNDMEIAPWRNGCDEEIAVLELNQDQKRQPAISELSLAGFQGSFH
jgi:hypothetical protein